MSAFAQVTQNNLGSIVARPRVESKGVMQALSSIVNSRELSNNNSLSSIDNSKRVDLLIDDCNDLIDPAYRLWFVKRFYKLSSDTIRRLAASVREAIAIGKAGNPQRLFSWLVKRECGF